MFTKKEMEETKKLVDAGMLDESVYESMVFTNQIQMISSNDDIFPIADTSVN